MAAERSVPSPALDAERLRRIVVARAGALCRRMGWELDELVNDVALELLAKQHTPSRYDATRSAWTTYVVRVTSSVLGNRLRRARVEDKHAWRTEHPEEESEPAPDAKGLDDGQAHRLGAVLEDARSVLGPVGYATVRAWMLHDREVAGLAMMSGIDEVTLWRYVALQIAKLSRGPGRLDSEWHGLWERHRCYARRRLLEAKRERGGREDGQAQAHQVAEGRGVGQRPARRRGRR